MSILPSIVDRSSLLVRLYEYLSSNLRCSGAYLFSSLVCQSTLFTVPSNAQLRLHWELGAHAVRKAAQDVAQGAWPLRRRGFPGIPCERCHGIRSKPRDKPHRVNPDTVATARLREATTRQLSCKQGPSPSAEQQHGTVAAVEPARSTPDQPTAQTDWTAAICTRPKLACSRAQAAGLFGASGARAWPPIERVGHLLVAPRPGPRPRHQAWEGGSAPSEGGRPPSHRVRELHG